MTQKELSDISYALVTMSASDETNWKETARQLLMHIQDTPTSNIGIITKILKDGGFSVKQSARDEDGYEQKLSIEYENIPTTTELYFDRDTLVYIQHTSEHND